MNIETAGARAFIVHRSSFIVCLALLSLGCGDRPIAMSRDDLGRAVTLPARVERVITLAPNLTEILFAIGAGERIAGTDDSSNYPARALSLPKVGAMQPNIEKIVALKPDLVLASTEGNHPSLGPALAAAGIPLYVIRTDRLAEIPAAMRRLGMMFGVTGGERAAADLQNAIEAQRRTRSGGPRVMFAVWTDPLYVGGRDTFTHDVIALTGATNAVAVTGWPQYSLESLASAPPDLLIYPRGAVTPQQVDALLARIPNIRMRVVAVDEDIFQRPGPRVAQAAAALNAILDSSAN